MKSFQVMRRSSGGSIHPKFPKREILIKKGECQGYNFNFCCYFILIQSRLFCSKEKEIVYEQKNNKKSGCDSDCACYGI